MERRDSLGNAGIGSKTAIWDTNPHKTMICVHLRWSSVP